jgi:hypothetical protein
MMNETPEAALRSRIADLEQQLKLADEGTSRLAQRCLELEKQLQTFYAAHPQKERQTDSPALVQPLLYYDAGFGFSQKDTVKAPDYEYDELNGMVTATFELPETAFNLRLDPGELPCCITDFVFSDDRILCRPVNGVPLHGDGILFLNDDPNFMLEGLNRFPAGMKLGVSYCYFPLEPPFSRAYSISRRPASASRCISTSWKRLRLTRSRPSRPCRRISLSCIRPTPS